MMTHKLRLRAILTLAIAIFFAGLPALLCLVYGEIDLWVLIICALASAFTMVFYQRETI